MVDTDNIVVYNFVDPSYPYLVKESPSSLWIRPALDEAPYLIDVPGAAEKFHWSSESDFLSIIYVADEDEMVKNASLFRTSIGIYHVGNQRFQILEEAYCPSDGQECRTFSGGEWVPLQNKLILRRVALTDLWVSSDYPEWAVVEVLPTGITEETEQNWQTIDMVASSSQGGFITISEDIIYTEQIVRGVRRLDRVTATGNRYLAGLCPELTGSSSLYEFSADFRTATFVNQSLTHPPEIHIWYQGKGCQQVTGLNVALVSNKISPTVREVNWESRDGTRVHGWLLIPSGRAKPESSWPLITFVHGGPTRPMMDEFADYFSGWPYPFAAYASNGIAVFMPNYRGTYGYGRRFQDPKTIEREPIDDIISGIDYLIEQDIADPGRLAISGHSHGAWLAPLVMTRANRFLAGSFAEGQSNKIVNYQLMSGWLNSYVLDVVNGGSLYDIPERYIELSADMHLRDIETAVLVEAGAHSLGVAMTGFVKAARHSGMPSEYIIYPQTGHNIRLPRLQKESAERNLDWFRFWLKGEEDPDPEKSEQYERWRTMRDERCASEEYDTNPTYCEQ